MGAQHPSQDDQYAHTLRLYEDLNRRMLYRAKQKYNGNVQAYLTSLVIRDTDLPDLPDCQNCGFKRMAEAIIDNIRGKDR